MRSTPVFSLLQHRPYRRGPCNARALCTPALAAALVATLAGPLSGCAVLAVGGAAAGVAAIHDRRDYTDMLDDHEIELRATAAIRGDKAIASRSRIAVTSYNHKVLLTGQADTEAVAAQAAGAVSRLRKVDRVIDEVSIRPPISLAQESKDVFISSRAKLALAKVSIPGFDPTRVKVVTEDGVVYLMGLVSPEEAGAAAEQVRWVPGVTRVVKLFELRDIPAPARASASAPAPEPMPAPMPIEEPYGSPDPLADPALDGI